MLLIGYLAMSVVGLTLGIIGAGGSILTVPILVYLFQYDPGSASYYSMGIVGVSALVALSRYWRQGHVDLSTVMKFVPASMFGVFVARGALLPRIPSQIINSSYLTLTKNQLILSLFAVLMILASRSMLTTTVTTPASPDKKTGWRPILENAIVAFFVGALTGLVGAGGGFLIIPTLMNLIGLQLNTAIGTSLVIIAINNFSGFFSGLTPNDAKWSQLVAMTLITTIFALAGTRLSKFIPKHHLKTGFGWFILLMGTFILVEQLLIKG